MTPLIAHATNLQIATRCSEYDKMAADHRTRGDSRAGFPAHVLGNVLESVGTHSKAFSEMGRIAIECAISPKKP